MSLQKRILLILAFIWSGCIVSAHAAQLVIGGSGADLGTMARLGEAFSRQNAEITVQVLPSLGSSGGIRAVAGGRIQIGLAARPLKNKERELPVEALHYARTPLVLATSSKNPADGVSSRDYLAVLEGRKVYWPNSRLMRVVLRPSNDSDTLMLQRFYPDAAELIGTASRQQGRPIAMSDQDAADALEKIPGSVGTSSLSIIKGENRALKALALDGVEPSPENLRRGQYPLWKDLFLVTGRNPDEAVKVFIDFLATPAAQKILEETGHEILPLSST